MVALLKNFSTSVTVTAPLNSLYVVLFDYLNKIAMEPSKNDVFKIKKALVATDPAIYSRAPNASLIAGSQAQKLAKAIRTKQGQILLSETIQDIEQKNTNELSGILSQLSNTPEDLLIKHYETFFSELSDIISNGVRKGDLAKIRDALTVTDPDKYANSKNAAALSFVHAQQIISAARTKNGKEFVSDVMIEIQSRKLLDFRAEIENLTKMVAHPKTNLVPGDLII